MLTSLENEHKKLFSLLNITSYLSFFVYVLIPLLTVIFFLSIFHYYQEFYREILNLKHCIFLMPKWKLIKENTGKQKCECLKVSTILLWNNYWMICWYVRIQVCSYIYPFLSEYKHIYQSANLYICKWTNASIYKQWMAGFWSIQNHIQQFVHKTYIFSITSEKYNRQRKYLLENFPSNNMQEARTNEA